MTESSRREKDLPMTEEFEYVRGIDPNGRSVKVPKSLFGGNLDVASEEVLGGVKASPKSDTDTNEVKIDPNTGKLYCPPSEVAMATAEQIGGIVAEVKTSEETEEVKIDPNTGKAYVKPSFSPDEEDITAVPSGNVNVLKLKNRDTSNGMGYIILRKDKTAIEQMTEPKTIYEIRYDFDLDGGTLEVPEGCVLDFKGGSFSNGTIVGNNTTIISGLTQILNVNLTGTWFGKGHITWFGADVNKEDNSDAIQRCMDAFDTTIIDVGTYKVTKTLIGSKSSVIKGDDNIYSNNRISFIPESDDVTTLFSLPNGTVQYYVIEGIRLMGNKAATVEGAKWKSGTICIDITSGANINLRHCMVFGFAKGLVSNFNSYYNNIDHCRFDSVHTCLDSFSPNNLIVTNTRVQNFCNFIYKLSGDGPLTIDKCAFEVFSGWILFSFYICQNVNFTNNYVEPRREVLPPLFSDRNNGKSGGNVLFEGNFNNFYSTGNEFQVNDSKKVYVFNMIESFVSQGNRLVISSNSCNLESYVKLTYTETDGVETTPVRTFVLKDSCVSLASSTIIYTSEYTQFTRIEEAAQSGIYEGYDPVTNIKVIPVLYSNIRIQAESGYLFDDNRPPSYIVNDGIMYLQGHIIRNMDNYPEPAANIGTLLGSNFAGTMANRHPFCYIQAFDDGNYAPVILKYTYSDRSLEFVGGDNTKGIILDGSYIPIRR